MSTILNNVVLSRPQCETWRHISGNSGRHDQGHQKRRKFLKNSPDASLQGRLQLDGDSEFYYSRIRAKNRTTSERVANAKNLMIAGKSFVLVLKSLGKETTRMKIETLPDRICQVQMIQNTPDSWTPFSKY